MSHDILDRLDQRIKNTDIALISEASSEIERLRLIVNRRGRVLSRVFNDENVASLSKDVRELIARELIKPDGGYDSAVT